MIPVEAYRAVIQSQDKTTYARAILDLRHWMIENGPHMPVYHFTSPECWINDPNGVIYHKGCITSSISMTPSPTANTVSGAGGMRWSAKTSSTGMTGLPTALYTGNVSGHQEACGMLARSCDEIPCVGKEDGQAQ